MTVEELHDGRGEVLKHTSSALAGERTLLCTLCGMCRLQSNKGSDAHSDFRITILSFWPEGETAIRQNGDPEV